MSMVRMCIAPLTKKLLMVITHAPQPQRKIGRLGGIAGGPVNRLQPTGSNRAVRVVVVVVVAIAVVAVVTIVLLAEGGESPTR